MKEIGASDESGKAERKFQEELEVSISRKAGTKTIAKICLQKRS